MNWINNIKKSFVLLALAAFVAIPSVVTMAQTLTDTIARDVTKWYGNDQSSYATVNSRFGVIVRHYRFDVHGGAAAATNIGPALPDGAMIIGGFVHVTEGLTASGDDILGVTGDTAGLLASAGDLEADNTVMPIIPDPSDITDYILIEDAITYVVLTPDAINTEGKFSLYLYYILTNP